MLFPSLFYENPGFPSFPKKSSDHHPLEQAIEHASPRNEFEMWQLATQLTGVETWIPWWDLVGPFIDREQD